MRFTASLVPVLLAVGAIAAPSAPSAPCAPTCLSDAAAASIVSQFATLLTGPQSSTFNSTASSLLASDFVDTSDSINLLAGIPLGGPTFPTKTAFIAGQGAQPPIPTLTTLDVFHTCDKIAWRWVATGIGSGKDEVKGINTFTVNPATNQIDASYSEFNSGAWLLDIGSPECKA